MTSLYLDPHAVISAWEEMGSDSWCDLDAPSGAASIALDLSGVEAALKAGSPGTSSPTSWPSGGGGQGGRGSAGGLALVPDCPPSGTPTLQVMPQAAAAPAAGGGGGAAGHSTAGAPLAWGYRPLSASNLISGAPQKALLLQPLGQGPAPGPISSSNAAGGAGGGNAGALSAGGLYTTAAGVPQGQPLLLRQLSGTSPPPASAAAATVVRAGGALYLLPPLQVQYAVKPSPGGQTTAPTASRSSSAEMAVVPDQVRRQGPTCSGQSDSSSRQGGLNGSSNGSGAQGWRGQSSSGGPSADAEGPLAAAGDAADNSPTSATAAAAASMAMGQSSYSPQPSSPGSPVSPRGTHAVTRRPGLVTRRLAAAAAAAAVGAPSSAPGLPTAGAAPLGPPPTTAATAAPAAAAAVTGTPAGNSSGAGSMREVYARARAECLARYRAKKARRKFSNTVRYHARKVNADKRPRIKGRFVKKEELAAMGWEDLEGGDADLDLEAYNQQQQQQQVACYGSYGSRAAVVTPPQPPAAAAAAGVPAPAAAATAPAMAAAQQVQDDLVPDLPDADLLFDDMDMADLGLLDDMSHSLVGDLLYY